MLSHCSQMCMSQLYSPILTFADSCCLVSLFLSVITLFLSFSQLSLFPPSLGLQCDLGISKVFISIPECSWILKFSLKNHRVLNLHSSQQNLSVCQELEVFSLTAAAQLENRNTAGWKLIMNEGTHGSQALNLVFSLRDECTGPCKVNMNFLPNEGV